MGGWGAKARCDKLALGKLPVGNNIKNEAVFAFLLIKVRDAALCAVCGLFRLADAWKDAHAHRFADVRAREIGRVR